MADAILSHEEHVLFKSRFSIIKFIRQWFLSMLICGGSMALIHYLGAETLWEHGVNDVHATLIKILAAISVASFSIFLIGFILYQHQYIILTTHRLMTTSIWNLKSDSVVLRNINNIEKRKTLIGILFRYGTIKLQDSDGTWIDMPYVPKVDVLEAKLAAASMRQGAVGG